MDQAHQDEVPQAAPVPVSPEPERPGMIDLAALLARVEAECATGDAQDGMATLTRPVFRLPLPQLPVIPPLFCPPLLSWNPQVLNATALFEPLHEVCGTTWAVEAASISTPTTPDVLFKPLLPDWSVKPFLAVPPLPPLSVDLGARDRVRDRAAGAVVHAPVGARPTAVVAGPTRTRAPALHERLGPEACGGVRLPPPGVGPACEPRRPPGAAGRGLRRAPGRGLAHHPRDHGVDRGGAAPGAAPAGPRPSRHHPPFLGQADQRQVGVDADALRAAPGLERGTLLESLPGAHDVENMVLDAQCGPDDRPVTLDEVRDAVADLIRAYVPDDAHDPAEVGETAAALGVVAALLEHVHCTCQPTGNPHDATLLPLRDPRRAPKPRK